MRRAITCVHAGLGFGPVNRQGRGPVFLCVFLVIIAIPSSQHGLTVLAFGSRTVDFAPLVLAKSELREHPAARFVSGRAG